MKIFKFIIACFLIFGLRAQEERFLSRDTLREIADFVLDNTGQERFFGGAKPLNVFRVKAGDIIFVQVELLDNFFNNYHPYITSKYVLISHNGDLSAPGKFRNFLDDDKIIAWFGQNPDCVHPKFYPIPIGLPSQNYPFANVELIRRFRQSLPMIKKDKLLYMNFRTFTHPSRLPIRDLFYNKSYCYKPFSGSSQYDRKEPEIYFREMAESKFILSPRGNGLDCHRTWEAVLMNSIAIVPPSLLNPLYEGLPIIVINDWNEITQEFLEQKHQEMTGKQYNLETLFIDYWIKKINAVKAVALAKELNKLCTSSAD